MQSKIRVLLIVSSFRVTFGGPLLNGNSFYCDVVFVNLLSYLFCIFTLFYLIVFLLRKDIKIIPCSAYYVSMFKLGKYFPKILVEVIITVIWEGCLIWGRLLFGRVAWYEEDCYLGGLPDMRKTVIWEGCLIWGRLLFGRVAWYEEDMGSFWNIFSIWTFSQYLFRKYQFSSILHNNEKTNYKKYTYVVTLI